MERFCVIFNKVKWGYRDGSVVKNIKTLATFAEDPSFIPRATDNYI